MKNRYYMLPLAVLWGALALAAWVTPSETISQWERRSLAQFPEVRAESLISGAFMEDFEEYTLDQFPLRDSFGGSNPCFTPMCSGRRTTTAFTSTGDRQRSRYIPKTMPLCAMLWIG